MGSNGDPTPAALPEAGMSPAFSQLRDFLRTRMSMSHVYQPVMLRLLLSAEEVARRDIAAAFLAYDQSQLDYYEEIARRYPTATLKRHGLIAHHRGTYRLAEPYQALTANERAELVAICDARLDQYLAARQDRLWRHRAQNFEPVPGSLRWQVIMRASGRCEACGVSAEQRALHVDHIIPRSKGGSNDLSNLQALCSTCNIQKLDGVAVDFAALREQLATRVANCAHCHPSGDTEQVSKTLAFGWYEGNGWCVAPRRHGAAYFDLIQSEINAIRAIERKMAEEAGRPGPAGVAVHIAAAMPDGHLILRYEFA